MNYTRRDFLTSAAISTAAFSIPSVSRAQSSRPQEAGSPVVLKALSRILDVNGRSAKVFGLQQDTGSHGLEINAGEDFNVALENQSGEPTLIHWHGLTPPWDQDGVPDLPVGTLNEGDTRSFHFPVGPGGTHWMHAHTLQEQNLLAAPLIVRTEADRRADEQEVVIMLHDFSFTPATEILARLQGPHGAGGMDHSAMGHGNMLLNMITGGGVPMDVNDIEYDAYLTNDRTLEDPEVVKVEKGGAVRLRIINGATSTAFTIDTGTLDGALIAVDGQDVKPVAGKRFPIVMGQRIDIRLNIPKDGGSFPMLALREGAKQRTGLVLASAGANVSRIAAEGPGVGPLVGLDLEAKLTPVMPLATRKADRRFDLILTGSMQGYQWGIAGGDKIKVRRGERIEISMRNMSMMTHPMHLHGHHFQVVSLNGKRVNGAVRDTVAITHMAEVAIAFDADNPGRWPLHCHHLYHMAAGMMGFVDYEGRA